MREHHESLRASVRRGLEKLALEQDLSDSTPIPPERELMERFDVSRGTLRSAIGDLVSAGLLRTEQGRGTYVNKEAQARLLVWDRLADVARPDSRFHDDYRQFVPDFVGRDACDEAVQNLAAWKNAATVFIAPDNSLGGLRLLALEQGKRVLVPTYGLRRGFVLLEADLIPPEQRPLAATLDGMESLGTCVGVAAVPEFIDGVDLMVSGAVAVTTQGIHIGSESRYLAVELAVLTQLELVSHRTPLIVTAHDCQVLEVDMELSTVSCVASTVVTPTRVLHCGAHTGRARTVSRTDERRVLRLVNAAIDEEVS